MEQARSIRRGRPSEGAREAILEAALALFMKRDYDDVATSEILERAGVSRGAMYHHFSGKRELYTQVWRQTEMRLIERLAAEAAGASTPFEALTLAAKAYLDEAEAGGEMVRIGLMQSRTVLGWERWREGLGDLGIGVIRAMVQAAIDSGEIERRDVGSTAHLLLAALIEAALLIATAKDQPAAREAAEPVLIAMLSGLRR